jgi:hypothetical protein
MSFERKESLNRQVFSKKVKRVLVFGNKRSRSESSIKEPLLILIILRLWIHSEKGIFLFEWKIFEEKSITCVGRSSVNLYNK